MAKWLNINLKEMRDFLDLNHIILWSLVLMMLKQIHPTCRGLDPKCCLLKPPVFVGHGPIKFSDTNLEEQLYIRSCRLSPNISSFVMCY